MRRWLLVSTALLAALVWCGAVASAQQAADGRRSPIVVLDPGHTPETVGAMSADGALVEHALNLALAQRVAALLEQRCVTVYLTRQADGNLVLPPRDENENGQIDDHEWLQPRTDVANLVRADVLVSLHFNGSAGADDAGTAVYYASEGPYIEASRRLAVIMQRRLVDSLRRSGYPTVDGGALSDAGLKPYGTLYSLGQNPAFRRKGQWPAVVIEPLFLTNPADAAYLSRPGSLDVLAQACARALSEYLGMTAQLPRRAE